MKIPGQLSAEINSERMKVKVGDEVTFGFRMADSGSEITSIEKK